MRTRRSDPEHQAAVAKRLALLGDELAAARATGTHEEPPPTEDPWWDGHTRLAAPRAWVPAQSPHALEPRSVPVPGRHAARRPPERGPAGISLRRAGWGSAQLAVVAVIVAVGLAVTCWWLVRGDAGPSDQLEAAPARGLVSVPPATADPTEAATTSGAATGPATVTVDVTGKVRHPGIAVLDAGARVVDAVEAAGGTRSGADLSGLNLARVLVDGEQVVVGVPAPAGVAAATPSVTGSAPAALVNLNTATEAELDTLPEVGPVTAASILAWRDEHGGFTSVDELLEIDGIGEATLGRIAPFVTV